MARYAHSLRNAPRERWHPLADHLEDTGKRAAAIAAKWGAAAWGRAAGRLHDVGKWAPEFEARLLGGAPLSTTRLQERSSPSIPTAKRGAFWRTPSLVITAACRTGAGQTAAP